MTSPHVVGRCSCSRPSRSNSHGRCHCSAKLLLLLCSTLLLLRACECHAIHGGLGLGRSLQQQQQQAPRIAAAATAPQPAAAGADPRSTLSTTRATQPAANTPRPAAAAAAAAAATTAAKPAPASAAASSAAAAAAARTSRAGSINSTNNSSVQAAAAGRIPASQAPAGQFAASSKCPGPLERLSAPGCPCTVHTDYLTDSSSSSSRVGVCPAGYRCSPSAAAAVQSAGCQCPSWKAAAAAARQQQQGLAMRAAGLPSVGVCMPCQLGELHVYLFLRCFLANQLQPTSVKLLCSRLCGFQRHHQPANPCPHIQTSTSIAHLLCHSTHSKTTQKLPHTVLPAYPPLQASSALQAPKKRRPSASPPAS